jgi:hypothetical protein
MGLKVFVGKFISTAIGLVKNLTDELPMNAVILIAAPKINVTFPAEVTTLSKPPEIAELDSGVELLNVVRFRVNEPPPVIGLLLASLKTVLAGILTEASV